MMRTVRSSCCFLPYLFCFATILFAQPLCAQQSADSITVTIAPDYDNVSGLHRFFLGENYRKLWATPVTVRIIHLNREKGGLQIEQEGGGQQTRSLRLRDHSGKEWVLRSVQKYPERQLPPRLKETIARDILRDQVATANPFAAITVPPLAEALGIPHSNPEIVYVATDTALGNYNETFAGKIFLLEERQPAGSGKTDNTAQLQKKLLEDNDVSVDQRLVLRARLLDMLLGDWDRHEDQWRWEKIKEGKNTVYAPVPRDRDQVYYQTSGVFPWIVSHQWLKSKFQPYREQIRDIKGWNFNARYFDRYFLTSLDESDWKNEIKLVQQTLSDSLITKAIRRMPPSIYQIAGEETIRIMIARRNNLLRSALEYYRFLSVYVDITASGKREHFDIKQDGEQISVSIYKQKKDSTRNDRIFHRNFDPAITKEIRLYGFDGEDEFYVHAPITSPIRIRMIGGGGEDRFIIDSNTNHRKKLYIYDRSDKLNGFPSRKLAKIITGTDSSINSFEPNSFQYDRFEPVTLAHYNTDIGISLILGAALTRHGFRRTPYAYKHQLLMDYSFARRSFLFTYMADYKKAFGKNDLNINIVSHGPNNVSNFFGIGNESLFENKGDKKILYYRNRYDYVEADIRISRTLRHFTINGGLAGQYYTSKAVNNEFKYLKEFDQQHPDANVFSSGFYLGATGAAELDTRQNKTFPSQGIHWYTRLTAMQQWGKQKDSYGQISSEFSFYLNPDKHATLIFANRTGAGTTVGDPAYFQLLKLGGPQTLRGFHTWRFSGKTMLYNNFELRLKLFNFNSYLLPGSVGVIGFDDIGRIWQPGEHSTEWHNGYGAGLYVNPVELVLIQFSKGFSKEGSINYLTIGYRF
ncbi:outer membrane protein assembly factor [Terrimonas sp. NA20]|uniref:Outer membrane protein assembly factor n=1 Tax=Terrimonas ginsenosidimutans TaxID=2908004 RepID=A0ABS9KT56_9BACT|nr:BamA/TamA family outer membrane protein [Terrimonas ginsenosidimutans]MCG2615517.1 outer membrane protein assembly factor [Terrimonas ginsenosidimutans]